MPLTLFSDLNMECVIRLLIACLCGGIIGVERTRRNKGAGMKTHIIVAVGAALFVIISKYGFNDAVYLTGAGVDVSRVASNIVTGVSFLGAGIIFTRGDSVQGLTTAAGVWVTAAIGLAIGAGLYLVGIFGAMLVLLAQVVLHRGLVLDLESTTSKIVVVMEDDPKAFSEFKKLLKEKNIQIKGSHIKKHKDESLTYTLDVSMPKNLSAAELWALVKDNTNVKSIGM